MLQKACVYDNKVFIPGRDSTLVGFEYSKNRIRKSCQKFRECFKLKIPLPINFEVKCVLLDAVENYTVGLMCMIVVVISESNEVATYMYCNALKNHLFFLHQSRYSSLCIKSDFNLFVTHGPMLVVVSQDEMLIHSLSYGKKSRFNPKAVFDRNQSFKVMQCTSIGQYTSNDALSVLLLVLQYDCCEGDDVEIITLAVNTKSSDMPVISHKVPLSLFFSKSFHNIIKSVVITNVSTSNQSVSNLQDICWDDNCSILCTKTDCLVFFNGVLKYVCHLPEPDTRWSIRIDCCQISPDIIHLLLSKNKDVYLYNRTPFSDELKVTKSWENISCVLSGEFLLNDLKGILLLANCSLDTWQDGCILSDISSEFAIDLTKENSIPAAAVERTIPAIRANVEAGKSAVADAELEISRKIGATLDALYKIQNQAPEEENADHHITSFQDSLLDILLYSDQKITKNTHEIKNESLVLQNHWKRIINNRFVLCWTFINRDEKNFCYPTLKLVIGDQHISSAQKVFIHKSSTFSIEDECRPIIYPTETFSLLVTLEIPQFQLDCIQIDAILCGFIGESTDYVLPLEEKSFTNYQQLLKTSISLSDGVYEEFKDIATLEDLACLKVTQQQTIFSLSCFNSDIHGAFKTLISATENARNFLLFESDNKNTLVFKNPLFPLYGVSITFQVTEQRELEIETFTRNYQETFLLVKYLYRYLPEDTLIVPCGFTASEQSELKQQAVCAMKEEIDLLLSGMQIISNAPQTNDQEATLTTIKNYLKLRNSLSRREKTTDHLMQNLYQIYAMQASNDLK